MANYGLKVSKSGDSVLTAASKDLRFNSENGAFKVFKSGDANFTTNSSGNGSVTIAHNMGYAPSFVVYRKATARYDFLSGSTEYTNAYFPVGSPNFYVKDDTLHHAIHAYADGTNLKIECKGGKTSTAMYFRYYIFVDQSQTFSPVYGALTNTLPKYGLSNDTNTNGANPSP